ncbi:AVB_G0002640.mRNA.1.CDS.1 [Saccharomyces cerevisiae]|nr:Ecm33p [Saccharomyces cerevisiae YJM248]CAI4257706.1 CPG_1a_G0002730.mRNA.1.CDS.1 [Saccharomyces cerevisiae]CAI4263831.1 AVB_G0002640.mRNA.1.CDS.1 [Saccharomyces cerevisiae]CAI7043051.1 AVB_G0002640.mRNA.1.CDS.1 [Saccharomyces cerevisiae]CAI7145039.1 CPG_1a_G0002730.mRNA.1.CDS.1 [Saccharomyces cerevisiae]
MQFKNALTVALLSASALAANSSTSIPSSCSIGTEATATAQADLDKISGCNTIVGNLTITGDLGSAALASIQEIDGSLTIFNATSLSSFSADSIKKITGDLNMKELTILTSASFGSLQEVDSINMVTLPAISTFSTDLQNANNIIVSDTTLESVEGFSTLKKVNVFNINNNRYLNSFQSSLQSVSDSLQFSSNGDNTTLTFDDLVWANNITLRDVNSISFGSLQTVNASLGFINNTLPSLNLTQLSKVGQSLSIVSNDELSKAAFSNLTAIGGGFIIANNTQLKVIDGFNKVQTVGGAIEVTGNFSTLDLSSLKSVRGGANFDSSSSNFSCNALKKLQSNGAIQGDSFVCKNGATSTSVKLSSTSTESSMSSATSSASSSGDASNAQANVSASASSSSSSSRGAAPELVPATSFMGVVAAVAVALL